ncbi:hypothetical protein BHE74_00022865 [Ensete ventricosum]|nr:hypothetical protein BHE74_00022865 [Ensete ventricosum]RZR80601.1 hypothetical protein BHM03_00006655 [Ensete ventricosum]
MNISYLIPRWINFYFSHLSLFCCLYSFWFLDTQNYHAGQDGDMTNPVASAASDFKAMLEAALLNQYKFRMSLSWLYDEESLSVKDILRDKMISGQIHTDVVSLCRNFGRTSGCLTRHF